MYIFKKFFTKTTQIVHNRNFHIVFMALTIALFVLSAGAPNAMGGIGK